MGMNYGKIKEWILAEDCFEPTQLGKCEAVMSLGNGYLGIRSAAEEAYLGETRDMLVNGTFNKCDSSAVTELPNAPDMLAVELWLNGERFTLEQGTVEEYSRELNIKTAELNRSVIWISPKGCKVKLVFRRVVSLERIHEFASRIEITPISGKLHVQMKTGINGRVTNTGSQHFTDGEKRFYEGRYMQYVSKTTESGITFIQSSVHRFAVNGKETELSMQLNMDQRRIYGTFDGDIEKDDTLSIEKSCNVYTSRDLDMQGNTTEEIQEISLDALKKQAEAGYPRLAADTAKEWDEQVWKETPIEITGDAFDQFAVRFAQYHLRLMLPCHDDRMNIGAKGLTGEGYKGHTFWDTEIFLLPYYTFTCPEAAKKLEKYRCHSLPGAHQKALHNGYQGAMFPWESAWLDDGEVTPEYCDVDIVTGRPLKVWSGFIEQHVTSDVAYGVWQYAAITGDMEFMEQYGYELILDTAVFWASRVEKGTDGKYHINDVVGPDEFREHVNDNAFTNYMAHWNMKKALEIYDNLKQGNPELFTRLDEKLKLENVYPVLKERCENMYLPRPTEEGVMPQDDRYLQCRDIDLSKYKTQEHVGGIMRDYNLEQIQQIQVSKQADVLVLFFLLEDLFSPEVKAATWEYYEPRTIHDSSLSLSTHRFLPATWDR